MNLCEEAEELQDALNHLNSSSFYRTVQRWLNLQRGINEANTYAAERWSDSELTEALQSDLNMLRAASNNLPTPMPSKKKRDSFAKNLERLNNFDDYDQISATLSDGQTLKDYLDEPPPLNLFVTAFHSFQANLKLALDNIDSQKLPIPWKVQAKSVLQELEDSFKHL